MNDRAVRSEVEALLDVERLTLIMPPMSIGNTPVQVVCASFGSSEKMSNHFCFLMKMVSAIDMTHFRLIG